MSKFKNNDLVRIINIIDIHARGSIGDICQWKSSKRMIYTISNNRGRKKSFYEWELVADANENILNRLNKKYKDMYFKNK